MTEKRSLISITLLTIFSTTLLCGCAPSYNDLRMQGQHRMADGDYGVALQLFRKAHEKIIEDPTNLLDMGECSMAMARDQLDQRNYAAAMRHVDNAINYYTMAIKIKPGYEPALWGKNTALELKQEYDAALDVAVWAATVAGPSARQQLFLARELEERHDLDAALLRYRQAIAMAPDNPTVLAEVARFYVRQGKKNDAIPLLKRAYKIDPYERGVWRQLHDLGVDMPRPPRRVPSS